MYHCMNVVTEREGHASAILLRAIEPLRMSGAGLAAPACSAGQCTLTGASTRHDLLSDDFFIGRPPKAGAGCHCQATARGCGLRAALGEAAFAVLHQRQPFVSRP